MYDRPACDGDGNLERSHEQRMTVAAELYTPLATARIVRFDWPKPSDEVFRGDHEFLGDQSDTHGLDMALTSRPHNARACYLEHWSPRRFERVGDVVFVPAGEVLRVRGDPPAGRASINFVLHPEPLRALFEDDLTWTDRWLDASLDLRSRNLRSLITRIGEEARHPGFASQMLAELIVGQMVIELFRYRGTVIDGPARGGLAPWRLRIIDERLAESPVVPTLAEMAHLCDLSVRHLTRGFRASRGCSIGEYVARSQIDHAKRLLATDIHIKSIAYLTGFSSPSNFSYAFRRATGLRPREYRRELRAEK